MTSRVNQKDEPVTVSHKGHRLPAGCGNGGRGGGPKAEQGVRMAGGGWMAGLGSRFGLGWAGWKQNMKSTGAGSDSLCVLVERSDV